MSKNSKSEVCQNLKVSQIQYWGLAGVLLKYYTTQQDYYASKVVPYYTVIALVPTLE